MRAGALCRKRDLFEIYVLFNQAPGKKQGSTKKENNKQRERAPKKRANIAIYRANSTLICVFSEYPPNPPSSSFFRGFLIIFLFVSRGLIRKTYKNWLASGQHGVCAICKCKCIRQRTTIHKLKSTSIQLDRFLFVPFLPSAIAPITPLYHHPHPYILYSRSCVLSFLARSFRFSARVTHAIHLLLALLLLFDMHRLHKCGRGGLEVLAGG